MNLFQSDIMSIDYKDQGHILSATWSGSKHSTGQFVEIIQNFRRIFEAVKPASVLWNTQQFDLVIPPDLQKWTDVFLNIPAKQQFGFFGEIGFIVSPDVLSMLSIMDVFEKGEAVFHPRYFIHEKPALAWLSSGRPQPEPLGEHSPLEISIHTREGTDKTAISLEIASNEVHQHLQLLKELLKYRDFGIAHAKQFLTLTRRERDIGSLIIRGYSNAEISRMLFISCDTVKTHRKNIIRKLDCKNLQELMRYAPLF